MARKRVAVYTFDGELSHHITHQEAVEQITSGIAEWRVPGKELQSIHKNLIPKGFERMNWQGRISGVLFSIDGPRPVRIGVKVLQLV